MSKRGIFRILQTREVLTHPQAQTSSMAEETCPDYPGDLTNCRTRLRLDLPRNRHHLNRVVARQAAQEGPHLPVRTSHPSQVRARGLPRTNRLAHPMGG